MRRFNPLILIDEIYFRKSSVISFSERIVPYLWWDRMFYIKTSLFNSFTFLISLIVNITLIYYTYPMYMEFHISCWCHAIGPQSSLLICFIPHFKRFSWTCAQWWNIVGFGLGIIYDCSHSLEVSCDLLLSHQFLEFSSHVLTHQSWVRYLLVFPSFDFMLSPKVFFHLIFVIIPDFLIFVKVLEPSLMHSLLHLERLRESTRISRRTYRFDFNISLLLYL